MKKNIIGLIILLGLFIGGCTKKIESPIIFDQYNITISTIYTYNEINSNYIIGNPTIKQYIQETETGFVGSIVIAKSQIKSEIDISTLGANNSKSITRKIIGAKKPSTDKFTFSCKDNKIYGILQEVTIEKGDEEQYLNQVFFVDNGYIYGISTMTIDKKENKNLAKSIKKITCQITE